MVLSSNEIKEITQSIKEINISKNIETPKVSVIIPAYNTEKYISKCLLSLAQQTLKELEIIIVNDGSTDDTKTVISMFAEHDSRIKIINQQNQKQGAARNAGMRIAKGEYIGFVDSDDWVDLDFFEKLYNSAKKHNLDIALGTNIRVKQNVSKKRLHITEEREYISLQDKFDVNIQWKNPCPTNKIYKRNLLIDNNILWPEGVYCEDRMFTLKAVYYANGIVSVPNVNYYYFKNPNSTVNNRHVQHFKKLRTDKNNANIEVLAFLKEKNANVRDKDFWAIKKDFKIFGLPLYRIKESLNTEKHLLFSAIPVYECNGGV